MRTRFLLTVAILGLLVSVASADTIIAPNLKAGATLNASGGNFTGSITFSNTSSKDQGLIAFSLELLQGNGVITSLNVTGLPTGWHFYDGKQNNSGAPCNETGNDNWFCADGFSSGGTLPFHMGDIPAHNSITFVFTGTYTGTPIVGNLDLMANGCSTIGYTIDKQGNVNCKATKWAYSDFIGGPPVPEPGSLPLLGTAIALVGVYFRRRK